MKKFSDYEAKKASGGRETLPAGGYVCKIFKAEEETYSWGSVLALSIDVIEGDYAGIWTRDYKNNTNEDKKWRGVFRLYVPKDDGSEKDAWTKNAFNNAMWAIEASNPGYVWNWDERTLKDKLVGVIYRDREWEMNGNTGWTTEAGGLTSVDEVRNGTFKALKPKPLKNKPAAAPTFSDVTDDDSELPF